MFAVNKFAGSLKAILVDSCTNGAISRPLQTRDQLRDRRVPDRMPGCSFKLCARVSEPYVEAGCRSGLEMEIIYTMQHIMEFEVSIILHIILI